MVDAGARRLVWSVTMGISAGRFLCSVLLAVDAPSHGQLAIVPMTSATTWRSVSVVSSSALSGSERKSRLAPFLQTLVAACAATRELISIVTARSSTNSPSLPVTGLYSR